jgi:metal transporter CNNM
MLVETVIFSLKVALLVAASSICSGLNISLMSLDPTDLERKSKLGNLDAQKVLPLRKNSHLSLASILLSNVAVISATSLVIDEKFGGLIAGISSTLLIVIFGEVVPQAFFARFALKLTSKFSNLLKIMIAVTYPVSKPLQLVLDKLFGHDQSRLHNRTELGMIISDHEHDKASELDSGEVKIMQAALSLSEKRVKEIMMPIESVYWIAEDGVIDADKLDEIKERRYSRIPIFDKKLTKCYGVLLMKDLLDIDFDNHPKRVTDLDLHPTKLVGSMTALDTMFRKFINIHTHLVPVEKDDRIIGIITIEDLVEEILDHEIEDESDHIKNKYN